VVVERDLPLRVARLKEAARSRRARIEPMRALVAGPGGRLRWRQVKAPPPPGPLGANVRPLTMATCDLDRPLMLGATPFPLSLQLGHECVAKVIAVGGEGAHGDAGAARRRPVSDQLRHLPAVHGRAHRKLRCGAARVDVRVRHCGRAVGRRHRGSARGPVRRRHAGLCRTASKW
jgi:hypothetical protein